jgi:uncharacterized membrane protein (UPF0127 family)
MAFPIDVVHLGSDGVVLRVLRELSPWRFGPFVRRASLVLELPSGTAIDTAEGDLVTLEPLNPLSALP